MNPMVNETKEAQTHSKKAILGATIVAAFIAAGILVAFVLPAEYNIDPTGIGKTFGLRKLAESKVDPNRTAYCYAFQNVVSKQDTTEKGYKVVFEINAETEQVYTKRPATYTFKLFDESGENEIPYDTAYVTIMKRDRGLIASAEVLGPNGFFPGASIDAAIQEPGEYTGEVIFVQNRDTAEINEITAKFDFKVVSAPRSLFGF
jgi:hypothetical protein